MSIDTACSSSGTSLQVACTSLLAGDCDTAVVGGLSILSNPDLFSGLCRGQFLSKTGPCATFDNKADGYCRADGCATVIVKRLEDAIADKDNILGVILGTATNHSADARSITHPHGPTQAALFTKILRAASVDALDVDYVEMHGTGTQAGDSTEMGSVTDVFAPVTRKRPSDRPLYLGAVKSNIGHGEAASGVTSLIKSLLILQHSMIPPHIGIKPGSTINTQFPKDLLDRSVMIPFKMTPFSKQSQRPRCIFVNNFSAAGGNTGVLLEDGPSPAAQRADPRSCHIVAIAAKTKQSMIKNVNSILSWLESNREIPLAHLAYTTTARRMHYKWRMSCAVSTVDDVRSSFSAQLAADTFSVIPSVAPRVVFVFTGQGSVYSGMGRELYEDYSIFRNCIKNYEQIARAHRFPSFIALLVGSETENRYMEMSPIAVQLALCCFEMALVQLWNSWGVRPQAVIGHSLGEYAALYAAGVLSASDTIYLVGTRANLLAQRCTMHTHAMLAVQAPVASIVQALGSEEMVTCINSPSETVLGGPVYDISVAAQKLGDLGLKCVKLRIPYAFHTDQVNPILDELEISAQSVKFCMEEVFLQSQTCEATAKITFKTTPNNGNFFFSPYWIDSCCHLSGFILNGTDAAGSQDQAFISHGWDSFRFIEDLQEQGSYQAFTCMLPKTGTKQVVGDVYVFSGDRLVGIAGEVIFQPIPRRVLDTILPHPKPSPLRLSSSRHVVIPDAAKSTGASEGVRIGSMKHLSLQSTSIATSEKKDAPDSSSIVPSFMEILRMEMENDLPDWDDGTSFVELGCDSLMALNVTSRLREDLRIEVDPLDFLTYPSLGEFKAFLANSEQSKASKVNGAMAECKHPQSRTRINSPVNPVNPPTELVASEPDSKESLREILHSTIAEEMAIDREELAATSDLAELGLDSLMILSILGALQDKLNRSIPMEWLTLSNSMSDIERAFGLGGPSSESDTSQPQMFAGTNGTATPVSMISDATTLDMRPVPYSFNHNTRQKATAVLLQGNTRTNTKNLFVFPDGGGSATSYRELGTFSDDWAVWGLCSPFIRAPEDYKCGIEGIASIFIEEIKRRQPIGPYSFAGWSIGGAIAYESTLQLLLENEYVQHLILIDAPCPLIMEPLPKDLPLWFAEIGLVGTATGSGKYECPQWLLSHFAASSEALYLYQPRTLPLGKCPQVLAIWCEDGVCKNESDPRPDPYPTGHAEFLLENRTDFGYNKWDALLDVSRFESTHVPGNHFTMMRGEPAKMLTTYIRNMLAKFKDN
ncbi:conidial yellow pigment biosynthesis polyketide synthase [Akanthomyces lecanii RCEF 1005]|uniref:Conidial yellow pigment biosynthesis polyketide synthase n=1 Tax=Akanthomyces lecanii RCEF 1005 TaxID=1081108 RepID=A0A168I3J8_CORDF|nr:conidial yellow pigment biosynthesis polyketide synthase [Akanthomyces lecanii RCEF 1005]